MIIIYVLILNMESLYNFWYGIMKELNYTYCYVSKCSRNFEGRDYEYHLYHDWNIIIMKELPVMSRSTREILEAVITNIIYV